MKDTPATLVGLVAIILGIYVWVHGWEDALLVVAVALPTCVTIGIISVYRKKGRK